MSELTEQIQVVARARESANMAKGVVMALRDLWVIENSEALNDEVINKAIVEVEEAKLRELTLAYYKETKEKKPAIGVEVKITHPIEYDANLAYDWAMEHKIALSLDRKAFEKIVEFPEARPGFVTVKDEPKVYIATKLPVEEKKESK